jgi:hypothetical protein
LFFVFCFLFFKAWRHFGEIKGEAKVILAYLVLIGRMCAHDCLPSKKTEFVNGMVTLENKIKKKNKNFIGVYCQFLNIRVFYYYFLFIF